MKGITLFNWLWKRKIRLLLGGVLFALLVIFLVNLTEGYTYEMRISYVYPSAESGLYPDGQRFLREDLIRLERIEEALHAMQKKGWYTDFSAKQMQNHLSVREYLTNPVQEKVEALRTQGREFTYYNNEYIISFKQPVSINLKSSDNMFGLARDNRSKEFVEELHRANVSAFLKDHTEGNVFADFSRYMVEGDADYDQIYSAYKDKIWLCMSYLTKKQNENNTFVSSSTNLSFNDLNIAYKALEDVQLARLNKQTSAERLTRSLRERLSRYQVDIERLELAKKKFADEHEIANTAMLEYDHTFSENIIVVSVNEENGLYQARPKTAYDTVTQRSLNAGVASSTAGNTAEKYKSLMTEYQKAIQRSDLDDQIRIADQYVRDLYAEYDRLAKLSVATIDDYIKTTNRNYIRTTMMESNGLSMGILIKVGMGFATGVFIVIILTILLEKRKSAEPQQ